MTRCNATCPVQDPWQDVAAHCEAHCQLCIVNRPRSSYDQAPYHSLGLCSRSLVVNNAGNCCQGWSAEGKRATKAHVSRHPLAAWPEEALSPWRGRRFFFQECTPLFDVDGCLRQPLAESYLVVDVVTGPGDLGWPASRERQLSAGLSLETLIWVGPKEPQRDTGSLQFHL